MELPSASKQLDLRLDQPPSSEAAATPLLGVLRAEIERSMRELAKSADGAPYHLAYEVSESEVTTLGAAHGALVTSSAEHDRRLDVDLRMGSPALDNTHPRRDEGAWDGALSSSEALPLDGSPAATRSLLWRTTEHAYRRAVEELVHVRAERQVKVREEDQSDDFSREPPARHLESPAHLVLDRAEWEARVRRLSARASAHPEVQWLTVTLSAEAETRSLVDSEGTVVQVPAHRARLMVQGRAVASDGMALERFESAEAPTAAELPSEAVLAALVDKVGGNLRALLAAPLVEPFAGPAILEGKAAGVFFHEVLGHRLEGERQKDEREGQTFATQVGRPVMPALVSVYDDPAVGALDGRFLLGHYTYDDQGVPARRASLVERGVLRGFLLARTPTRGFLRSNGHGRREPGYRVVARQGNLLVDPVTVTSRQALSRALLDEIARQHKPYGLRFEAIAGGFTGTTRDDPQSFKVLPVMVYRVYPDGREELVRGVDLEGTPLTALSTILAAANDFQVFNGMCGAESGWVPVSAASPSLLLSQIEVARQAKDSALPPLLPAPPATDASPLRPASGRSAVATPPRRALR